MLLLKELFDVLVVELLVVGDERGEFVELFLHFADLGEQELLCVYGDLGLFLHVPQMF